MESGEKKTVAEQEQSAPGIDDGSVVETTENAEEVDSSSAACTTVNASPSARESTRSCDRSEEETDDFGIERLSPEETERTALEKCGNEVHNVKFDAFGRNS